MKSQTISKRLFRSALGFLSKKPSNTEKTRALTLVEMLISIGVLGAIASIGLMVMGDVFSSARNTQIQSSVSTVNQAIDIYLATGGSLDGLSTPAEVLAKLKTTRSDSDRKRHIGAGSGRLIDPRLVAIWDASKVATTKKPLAIYDTTNKRFGLKTSGTGGVVTFRMDSSLNEMTLTEESRDGEAFAYSASDTWVWDYKKMDNPDGVVGPDTVATTEVDPSSGPPSGPGSTPGSTPGTTPGSGPGTPGPGTTPGGSGTPGTTTPGTAAGPGTTGPGSTPGGTPGGDPDPIRLSTPYFSQPSGGYPAEDFPISVTINGLPTPGTGQTVFKLGSGAWQNYSGAISIPPNTTLVAQNVATHPDYIDSYNKSATYYPTVSSFTGNTSGVFSNPAAGGGTLVSSITDGGSFFSHGDPTLDLGGEIVDAGTANTLQFTGGSVGSSPDSWFTVGNLNYHNGTTFSDSHATYVELEITIALTSPAETLVTTLDLDLINTENTDNANNSADIVKIRGFDSVGFTVDGVSYSLDLEFGGTDSFGFSTGNQFHVFEGATGSGEIRGRFREN